MTATPPARVYFPATGDYDNLYNMFDHWQEDDLVYVLVPPGPYTPTEELKAKLASGVDNCDGEMGGVVLTMLQAKARIEELEAKLEEAMAAQPTEETPREYFNRRQAETKKWLAEHHDRRFAESAMKALYDPSA